jgi:hypothetical protein
METLRADIIYARSKQMAAEAPPGVPGAPQRAAPVKEAEAVCSKQAELASEAVANATAGLLPWPLQPTAAAKVETAGEDVPVPESKAQFAEPVKSPNHNMTERKEMLKMQAAREAALPRDIIRVDPGSTNLPQVVESLPDDKTLGARKLAQVWSWTSNYTVGQRRKLKQAVGQFTLINNPDLGELLGACEGDKVCQPP